jgi:ribosome maturation factor RimP
MQPADERASEARFIQETGLAAQVAGVVEPVLQSLGFRLVRVNVSGRDGNTVQVMLERPGAIVTIEDCEAISRELSPLLDAYDPLPGSYRLEVSSPGIDRPLVRPSDFVDWRGYEARIELKQAVDGRKRYRGTLEGYEAGEIRVACDLPDSGRRILGFALGLVADARLVLTEELVRESLRRSKKGEAQASDGRQGHSVRGH